MKKSLLASLMLTALISTATAGDYEVRMPTGAPTIAAEVVVATVNADGATNTSTTSATDTLTGPSTKISVSSFYPDQVNYKNWHVFDGQGDPAAITLYQYGWLTDSASNTGWVAYEFDAPIIINKYAFYGLNGGGAATYPKNFNLEGSNDGSTWVILGSESNSVITGSAFNYYSVINDTAYLSYRLNITANQGGPAFTGTTEIKFIEAQAQ